jgi:cell division septation protein DedD
VDVSEPPEVPGSLPPRSTPAPPCNPELGEKRCGYAKMSRMTATDDREPDEYDEEVPRSLFSSLWFRALVVVLALGVVAAIAVPYILDMVSAPPPPAVTTPTPPAPPVAAVVPAPPAPAPGTPSTEATPGGGPPEPAPAAGRPPEPPSPAPAPAAAVRPQEVPSVSAEPRGVGTTRSGPGAKLAARTEAGPYWVQVGAFRDPEAARRLAERLRAENYRVTESVTAVRPGPEPTDRYQVVISGASPGDVEARLRAKGLRGESVGGSVMVSPGLPLREAVALSKELAAEGFQVQVRRTAGTAAPGQEPLHRVRVGAFADRGAALAVMKELEAKGYRVFLARGDR